MLLILLKIVLMLVATPGIMAPAATATNPAMRAYSIRSCPRVSFQILSFQTRFVICFIHLSSLLNCTLRSSALHLRYPTQVIDLGCSHGHCRDRMSHATAEVSQFGACAIPR